MCRIINFTKKEVFKSTNKKTKEIVANMIKDGVESKKIANYSGLSEEEVEKMKNYHILNI